MKAFLFFAFKMNVGSTLSYEYLDDVSSEEEFCDLSGSIASSRCLFQVKYADVHKEDVVRIFTNWILSIDDVEESIGYRLVQRKGCSCDGSLKEMDASEYISLAKRRASSHPKSSEGALFRKLKEDEIECRYRRIIGRLERIELDDAFSSVKSDALKLLNCGSANETKFCDRFKELQGRITCQIVESMYKGHPFSLSFSQLMKLCDDICLAITDERYEPSFHAWRARNPSKSIEELASRREVVQLECCFDDVSRIMRHIGYCDYYGSLRYRKQENCQGCLIADLEEVTHENFDSARDALAARGEDCPELRIQKTKEADNSHCFNDEEKWGSCIFLTKSDTPSGLKISWKDGVD